MQYRQDSAWVWPWTRGPEEKEAAGRRQDWHWDHRGGGRSPAYSGSNLLGACFHSPVSSVLIQTSHHLSWALHRFPSVSLFPPAHLALCRQHD